MPPGDVTLPRARGWPLLRIFVRLQLTTGAEFEPQRPWATHQRAAGRVDSAHRGGYAQNARLKVGAVVLLLFLQRLVAGLKDVAGYAHIRKVVKVLGVGKNGRATAGARSRVRIIVDGFLPLDRVGLDKNPAQEDLTRLVLRGAAVILAVGIDSVAEQGVAKCRVQCSVHVGYLRPIIRSLLLQPVADKKVTYKRETVCPFQCFGSGSGWIRVFSPNRIRVLKVQIRPFLNLCDLKDGFDKVLEEPGQKGHCKD